MADKKRGKRRKDDYPGAIDEKTEKPQKEEFAVAKWLRKNVSVKRTKFVNHNVEYFTGSKAVDALLESSPWAKPASESEQPLFANRQDISHFLDRMLRHKFFHRAKKVPISEQELKLKQKKKDKGEKKDKDDSVKKRKDEENAESSHAEGGKESESGKAPSQDDREKKKRKIRLEMHLEQCFVDGLDAYVWIYEPIPVYYWLCGFLLVLGAIAICMFPLWPPTVRMGVYYLSVATAGFLMLIIALAVVRLIIFCLVWLLTLGVHHLWLFPNLTEDVGFFASFWPLYQYEYKGKSGSSKSSKKKKKDKDSDAEDDNNGDDKEDEDDDEDDEDDHSKAKTSRSNDEEDVTDKDNETDRAKHKTDYAGAAKTGDSKTNGDTADDRGSETESEGSSQQSQTGKDFEIVDRADLQDS